MSLFVIATLEFVPAVESALAEAIRVLDSDETFVVLIMNTKSEYVQSNLQRGGSYFQRIVHRDSDTLGTQVRNYVDGTKAHFLGIDGETGIERSDPTTAAVTAVGGTPTSRAQ
jgi:molybdopterin biosynthesis enzyme MoaB